MKIYLNDKPIDFELRGEKKLGEVLIGLRHWAEEQKHFLGEVRVNGGRIDIEEEEQVKLPLNQVKEIHCEILSAIAYAVSVWSELRMHLEPFKGITAEIASEQIEDISARLEWIKKVINRLDRFFEIPNESKNLIKNIKNLELSVFKLKTDPKHKEGISSLLQLIDRDLEQGLFKLNLKILKSGFKNDLLSVRNSIENYILFLEILEEKLLDTAVAFQKSRIKSALEDIPGVVEGLGIFFLLNQQIDDDLSSAQDISELSLSPRKEIGETLKKNLELLEEAIKNKNYIEVADIMEYEIKEMLPPLRKTLEKILSEIDDS